MTRATTSILVLQHLLLFQLEFLEALSPLNPKYLRRTNENLHKDNKDCVGLECFPQWRAEEGYWIGDYSFYQGDGTPFESSSWNYPYNSYKGFITGAIHCYKYRQRNVFFYPPQEEMTCLTEDNSTVGIGQCGENGNTKVFFADQEHNTNSSSSSSSSNSSSTTTTTVEKWDGQIEGLYGGIFSTKTTLIGNDNAILYQVYDANHDLFQSQLTTLSTDSEGIQRRVRCAQGFVQGIPQSASFYRERQVSQEEFYSELQATMVEYNILESDMCAWMDPGPIGTEYTPGLDGCRTHLESSFDIKDGSVCPPLPPPTTTTAEHDGNEPGTDENDPTSSSTSGTVGIATLWNTVPVVATGLVTWSIITSCFGFILV